MKVMPIHKCTECRFLVTSPYPTADSFERPEYWWCKNPGNDYEHKEEDHESEKHRQFLINEGQPRLLRKIAGYVEWTDDIEIPNWRELSDKES